MVRIHKSTNSDIVVERSRFEGRDTIDVRVWFMPAGATEMVRSRKGLQFDVSKAQAVIDALAQELAGEPHGVAGGSSGGTDAATA